MPNTTTGPGRSGNRRQTSNRPLGPRPQRVPASAKSPARLRLERLSLRPLAFLHRLPRIVPALLAGALLIAGLIAPNVIGGVCLLILGLGLAWLVSLSWPALNGSSRFLRVAVVVAVLFVGVWRLTGHG